MTRTIKFAIAALAFAAAPITMLPAPASAEGAGVAVTIGPAFGYSDGYWDQHHAWHTWRDRKEEEAWRHEHAEHFYDRRHDAVENGGWRANDDWWEHH
ncbi:MAG TPA: hypothetical protein VLV50_11720 [Stellaceae bacterium]|nr:hypothetical protein [Stellaceae bacterium]